MRAATALRPCTAAESVRRRADTTRARAAMRSLESRVAPRPPRAVPATPRAASSTPAPRIRPHTDLSRLRRRAHRPTRVAPSRTRPPPRSVHCIAYIHHIAHSLRSLRRGGLAHSDDRTHRATRGGHVVVGGVGEHGQVELDVGVVGGGAGAGAGTLGSRPGRGAPVAGTGGAAAAQSLLYRIERAGRRSEAPVLYGESREETIPERCPQGSGMTRAPPGGGSLRDAGEREKRERAG